MIRFGAAAALVAAFFSQPADAEVVEQSDGYFVTRDAQTVSADPYDVWLALIAPGKWWDDAHTWSGDADGLYISAQAGGCFCELLPERTNAPADVRRGSALHMTVLQADPPRVLRMRGGLGPLQSEPVDGVLTITLKPVEGGTRILWEYVVGGQMRFEVPVIAEAVDGVMSQQLHHLAASLGGGVPAGSERGSQEPSSASGGDVGAEIDAMAAEDEATD